MKRSLTESGRRNGFSTVGDDHLLVLLIDKIELGRRNVTT
jgi:hypothetical protein